MSETEQRFSVQAVDDYVHLKTWGVLNPDDLGAPANAALALAKEKGLDKLLDDIRDIDTTGVSIPIQAKAMGILWQLRSFKKVAIILKGSRIRTLFFGSLEAIHLDSSKFKGFETEEEAIAWLKQND